MQKLTLFCFFYLFVCLPAWSQEELEYTAKEIQKRRISKILVWERAEWDEEKFGKNVNRDSCVYIEKEYDTKGRMIAMTENYCPEKMHFRGDYYTYDNEGRVTAHSRSEYGIGEVEFRGIRYEPFREYDSIMYDQGLKQIKIVHFDTDKKVLKKETFQDDSLQESHEYIYNSKNQLVSEAGMHRKKEFQKTYKYNENDSIVEEKIYQGDELVQREFTEHNPDGSRLNFYNISYQGKDSIVQRTHYEYFTKQHLKKIIISEDDENGVFHQVQFTEFDKKGNIVKVESRIEPENPTLQEYTYTSNNRLKSIVWKQQNQFTAEAHYHYNNHNLLSSYSYQEKNGQKKQIDYFYDKDLLMTEKIFKTDGKFIKKYHYTYLRFD